MSDLEVVSKSDSPEATGKPAPTKPTKSASDVPAYQPLQSFMDIDRPTNKERTQLEEIHDYVSKTHDDKNEGSFLMAIREIEHRLTPPKLGETRLGKLYEYVRLQRNIKSLEDERKQLVQ